MAFVNPSANCQKFTIPAAGELEIDIGFENTKIWINGDAVLAVEAAPAVPHGGDGTPVYGSAGNTIANAWNLITPSEFPIRYVKVTGSENDTFVLRYFDKAMQVHRR